MSLTKIILKEHINTSDKRYSPDYIRNNFKRIGEGTEGEIFTDGNYAYKVVPSDLVAEPEDIIKQFVDKSYRNVVKVYDAWSDDWETVIKMELLEDLPDNFDEEEFEEVREKLWNIKDGVNKVYDILNDVKDSEIRKMLKAIIDAGKQMNSSHFDIGFHNLMYDPKTKEYKQIDLT